MATVLLAALAGCTSVRWTFQAVGGHLDLLSKREPISELLGDPDTPEALRAKLELALRLRNFASAELGLPDNGSYRSYADLQRDAVVWNVIATPPLSLQPHTWCYPLAGCLAYRGWYRRSSALREARQLHARELDVLISPATAYSTLGWFDDPVLNTMLAYSDDYLEPVLGSLIFHELAHQQLFVAGSTGFNEAFAETVANEGVARWLRLHRSPADQAPDPLLLRWQAWQQADSVVNQLLTSARSQLQRIYAQAADRASPDQEQALQAKQQVFMDLRLAYLDELGAAELNPDLLRGLLAWREWFAQPLNNAHLALQATYQQGVAAFTELLICNRYDLAAFYQAAVSIGEWPAAQREAWLQGGYPNPAVLCAAQ